MTQAPEMYEQGQNINMVCLLQILSAAFHLPHRFDPVVSVKKHKWLGKCRLLMSAQQCPTIIPIYYEAPLGNAALVDRIFVVIVRREDQPIDIQLWLVHDADAGRCVLIHLISVSLPFTSIYSAKFQQLCMCMDMFLNNPFSLFLCRVCIMRSKNQT